MIPFLILLAIEVVRNYTLIVRLNRIPNHTAGWIFRAVFAFLCARYGFEYNYLFTLIYCVAVMIAFWFPFDVLLNFSRGLKWNYLGYTSQVDVESKKIKHIWLYKFVLMLLGLFIIINL